MAAAVDRHHPRQAEIPGPVGGVERRHKAAGGRIHVDGNVQAAALLQGVEGLLQPIDRLVAAVEGAAHDAHHADRVLIAALHGFRGAQLQPVGLQRHQPRLHVEVGAELVPADLGVGAHHQIGAAGLQPSGLAPLPPAPLEHQAAEHAALAGAGGGGADGGGGIGGMPEVGQDAQTALLQLCRLGIFVLVDDVLVGAFLHQPARLRLHPGAHEGGQVEPGVAVQHQVIVDQLIGQIARQSLLAQPVAGDLRGLQLAQLQAVAQGALHIQLAGAVGLGCGRRHGWSIRAGRI